MTLCVVAYRLEGADPDISIWTRWYERLQEALMELQELGWLCLVGLFLASLLIVLAWLCQYSLSVLQLWRSKKTARRGRAEAAWHRQQVFPKEPHQSQTGGVWSFLLKLCSGKDSGPASQAGLKGLLATLFSFRSFREHWQRTWVKALNEQACRHGVSWWQVYCNLESKRTWLRLLHWAEAWIVKQLLTCSCVLEMCGGVGVKECF